MSYEKKKELISLVSALISKKYGLWQENEEYLEYRNSRRILQMRLGIVEKLFLDSSKEELTEEELKENIQKVLKK